MDLVTRRVTYKLYPSKGQLGILDTVSELHRQLYNAALDERIQAWRKQKKSIGFSEQCRSVTEIRSDDSQYAALNTQSLQVTLKRLDEAFGHFFRRCAGGGTPGFPRFKSKDRFKGFGFKTHGNGFRFTPGADWQHGKLRLSGVGTIKARGKARTQGTIKGCSITRRYDGWYLSLVVECRPARARTDNRVSGADPGVSSILTLASSDGSWEKIANPRHIQRAETALKRAQRTLSRRKRGSKGRLRAKRVLQREHRKIRNRRTDFLHQISAEIVSTHEALYLEVNAISNMTASAGGTIANPGKNVPQKAGLNRAILDTGHALFRQLCAYKAEEACTHYGERNARHAASQRCPMCELRERKKLSQRIHKCPCGFTADRDVAAAMVVLKDGLATTPEGALCRNRVGNRPGVGREAARLP